MDGVQNLRKAVLDAKLRLNTAKEMTSKWKSLHTVYINYLQRYGYLVVFADYLLQKARHFANDSSGEGAEFETSTVASDVPDHQLTSDAHAHSSFPSFVKWLKHRPEIDRILDCADDES